MIFAIRHTTRFSYDGPVFLEPHTLRLQPRGDSAQRLTHFALAVSPVPAGSSPCVELDGNAAVRLWFEGEHRHLEVTAESRVETAARNPFDFFLDPGAVQVPMQVDEHLRPGLAPYLDGEGVPGEVAALAEEVLRGAGGHTLTFLSDLNLHLYQGFTQIVRPDGDPLPPEQTLARREGACRDLAALFMAACRRVGIPARFVSGYQADPPQEEQHDLHAWAEVYLPGAGWRGYDPTRGLLVTDRHVVLAAGPSHDLARPTQGTFRGTGVRSRLEAQISIQNTSQRMQQP